MKNILYIGDGGVSQAIRLQLQAKELADTNYANTYFYQIGVTQDIPILKDMDIVVYSRPFIPELIHEYKKRGARVIVDMDDDFFSIPKSHPGYSTVGPGNQAFQDAVKNSIREADVLTVTNIELMKRFSALNKHIFIIPNGWSAKDGWKKNLHNGVCIGWAGTITHRNDFSLCVSALNKIVKNHKNVTVLIAGDYTIYDMVKAPFSQKRFIPMIDYEYYPWVIGWFDILIAPLQDTYFNTAKSDIKLVDAGAIGIPYVASDISIYRNYHSNYGGVLVSSSEEWHEALDGLVESGTKRVSLGNTGKEMAEKREIRNLVPLWKAIFES